MRNRPGSRSTASRKGVAGFGRLKGWWLGGPRRASSSAAESRTLRVTAWKAARPAQASLVRLRPRLGFRPKTPQQDAGMRIRSEEHTSELQSLMRISYAVFCLKKKTKL